MKTTFYVLESFCNLVVTNYLHASLIQGIAPTRFAFRMRRFGRMR